MKKSGLSALQRKNILAYAKCQREIAMLLRRLQAADTRRRRAIERIFDEVEKDPSQYTHVTYEGKSRKSVPMTEALARKFKKQMLQQQQQPKNPHGGPGCDDCDDIKDCWCAFKVGPLCCYLCLSPAIVQCHF